MTTRPDSTFELVRAVRTVYCEGPMGRYDFLCNISRDLAPLAGVPLSEDFCRRVKKALAGESTMQGFLAMVVRGYPPRPDWITFDLPADWPSADQQDQGHYDALRQARLALLDHLETSLKE